MRRLKGVVLKTKKPEVLIELDTGRRVWTTPPFILTIQDHVLVSWDYTNDCIGTITTQKRLAGTETERDKVELASMFDVFQNPLDEEFEGDMSDTVELSNGYKVAQRKEEDSMIDIIDVFQSPLGEDVDCDSIVELRYDIHI